jgi:pyruvate dehydrogenase E1 component alpha subunit
MKNVYTPDASTQLGIYRRMALIKANDERSRKVIRSGKLVMPYYSPRGQEVIPSAMSACLTDQDYICTIYRGIHDMDLLRKSGEFFVMKEDLDDQAEAANEGI